MLNPEEKAELHDIFQGSKKKTAGFESIEKIDKAFSPRLALLQLIMLQAMRNLEHFEAHNPIDEVVNRHHRGVGSREEREHLVEAI